MRRFVLHVDLDQFIAAVEVLRRPELRGKPVIIGGDGDPTKRGVVSTASYEARAFKVRSGMALRIAAKRCPEAIFLPVDGPTYEAASKQVMAALRSLGARMEVAGWDEAVLAFEGDDPEAFARRTQRTVREATGLESSIGIGDNRLQAKIASEMGKPGGVFRLTFENWSEVMDARPTDALWGIGSKRAKQLREAGIGTVAALANADEAILVKGFGPALGPWMRELARGEASAEVGGDRWHRRSLGREETFQQDIGDPEAVRDHVARIAAEIAGDLPHDGRNAERAVVKVRFAPFETHTRSAHVRDASPGAFVAAAAEALARFDLDRPVRLLGVRADLEHAAEPEKEAPAG